MKPSHVGKTSKVLNLSSLQSFTNVLSLGMNKSELLTDVPSTSKN